MSVVTAKLKAGSGVGARVVVAVGTGVVVAAATVVCVLVGRVVAVGGKAAGVQALRRSRKRLPNTHKYFIAALYLAP
jgi:hypothetical protein